MLMFMIAKVFLLFFVISYFVFWDAVVIALSIWGISKSNSFQKIEKEND